MLREVYSSTQPVNYSTHFSMATILNLLLIEQLKAHTVFKLYITKLNYRGVKFSWKYILLETLKVQFAPSTDIRTVLSGYNGDFVVVTEDKLYYGREAYRATELIELDLIRVHH